MADIFDTVTESKKTDIFDEVSGDIFNRIAPKKPILTMGEETPQVYPEYISGEGGQIEWPAELKAIPPTVKELALQIPGSKFLTKEGRKELKGKEFIGKIFEKQRKLTPQEIMDVEFGSKKIPTQDTIAGVLAPEIQGAIEWAAFPTAIKGIGAIGEAVLPKTITKFLKTPIGRSRLTLESEIGEVKPEVSRVEPKVEISKPEIKPTEIHPEAKTMSDKLKVMLEKEPTEESGFISPPTKKEIKQVSQSLYQKIFNRMFSIENASKRANQLGAYIKPGENPELLSRTYLGNQPRWVQMMEDKTFRITSEGNVEFTGEGFKPILQDYQNLNPFKKVEVAEKDLNDFLKATRYIEDLQRPNIKGEIIAKPEQTEWANQAISGLTQKYGNLDLFNTTGQRIYDFQKRVLRLLVESGRLSEDQFTNIISKNKHYVPFNRVLTEEELAFTGTGRGQRFKKTPRPVKTIKGSEREVEDVLESIAKNTYRVLDISERNKVSQSLALLEDTIPDVVKNIRIPRRPIKVNPEEVDTITRTFTREARQVREEVKRTGGIVSPQENVSPPMQRLEKIVTDALQHRGMTEGEANVYLHKIKQSASGRQISDITGTETIEKTINNIIRETITTIQAPIESTIFRPVEYLKPNQIEYWVDGNRHYMEVSPLLAEAMSGLNDISMNMFSKIMALPAKTLRVGATITPEFMFRNPIRDQFTALINTTVGFKPFINAPEAISKILGKDELYQRWISSGGAMSTMNELNRNNTSKLIKELMGKKSILGRLNIISKAQDISQLFEQTTRLQVFENAIKRGLSDIEAGFISRESTLDFARRGSEMANINSSIAFLNAGLQGLDKSVKVFKNNPVSATTKSLISITIPSVALFMINKDNPDYWEQPRWQRDLFWLIPTYTKSVPFIRIPKPFLYGQVFGSSVERFMAYAEKQDPSALRDFSKTMIDSLSPVSGDMTSMLLPTAVKPLIENEVNWNFFRERPIVPRGKEELPPFQQYTRFTTETAKDIGRELNISPLKIQNIISGYTGGSGQYGLQILDFIQGKTKRMDTPDIPLVKGFTTRPSENISQSVNDFYEDSDKIITLYNGLKTSSKAGNVEDATHILKSFDRLWLLAPQVEKRRKEIDEINKKINMIDLSKTISPEKKKEIISILERNKMEKAQKGNEFINKIRNTALIKLKKEKFE